MYMLLGAPREAAKRGDGRKLLEEMRVGRGAVVRSVPERRGLRWTDEPARVAEAVLRFSARSPPLELLASVLCA